MYEVVFSKSAERDLEDILEYIAKTDSESAAAHVLDRIHSVIESLSNFPNRGAYPPELLARGIRSHRQVFFKPYRIIYQVWEKQVEIQLIADGRRDMDTLFKSRTLLRGNK